jgi:hypothetical protein
MDPQTPSEIALPVAARGTVDRNIHCRQCGYNLRTLERNARCPECGAAVAVSLRRDRLRFANPRWLSTIRWGLRLSQYGSEAVAGVFIGTALVNWQFRYLSAHFHFLNELVSLAIVLFLLSLVLLAAGAWMVGVAPVNDTSTRSRWRLRAAMRWCFTIAMALRFLAWLDAAVGFYRTNSVTATSISLAIILCMAGGIWSYLYYVRALALQVPQARLAKWSRILAWGVPALYCVYIVTEWSLMIAPVWLGSALMAVIQFMTIASGAAWILCGVILARLGKVVSRQRIMATRRVARSTARLAVVSATEERSR